MSIRQINPALVKIAYWLRVNGPSSREQIEAATGITLTPTILAQGDYLGMLRWVEPLGLYA